MVAAHAPEDQMALPALAYSASYPVGIVGIIASLLVLRRVFRIDVEAELKAFEEGRRKALV